MTVIRWLILIFILALLSACKTMPKTAGISVSKLDENPDVLHFDLPETPYGRMVIDAGLPNGRTVKLVLDTGATLSLIHI